MSDRIYQAIRSVTGMTTIVTFAPEVLLVILDLIGITSRHTSKIGSIAWLGGIFVVLYVTRGTLTDELNSQSSAAWRRKLPKEFEANAAFGIVIGFIFSGALLLAVGIL